MIKSYLISIAGPAGAGKTTTGFALADILNTTGHSAIVLDDDVVRRQILGRGLADQLTPADFGRDISHRVIMAMQDNMVRSLRDGKTVINVSGYWSEASRRYVEGLAGKIGVGFYGIWLSAPEDVLRTRIRQRQSERQTSSQLQIEKGHASDTGEDVLDRHPENSCGIVTWTKLDTTQPRSKILQEILKNL